MAELWKIRSSKKKNIYHYNHENFAKMTRISEKHESF